MGFEVSEIAGKILGVVISFTLIVALLGAAATVFNQINDASNETITQTVKLKSVNYENVVNGQFFLGYGNVNAKNYYFCYEVLEDTGIKLLKLDADKTIIYETLAENEMAYAEIDKNGFGDIKEIRLFLPKNTIQVEYNMSLGE